MRFLILVRLRIVSAFRFVSWFFFDTPICEGTPMLEFMGGSAPNELPEIIDMRKKILDLQIQNTKLIQISEELIDSGFGEAPESLDIDRLKSQFGMFFVRSGLTALPYEEFHFLHKTFMDSLSCAYQLGVENGDRATKSIG